MICSVRTQRKRFVHQVVVVMMKKSIDLPDKQNNLGHARVDDDLVETLLAHVHGNCRLGENV